MNPRFSRLMIVLSAPHTLDLALSPDRPERAHALALAAARAALAGEVLGEPEGVAAALRTLEALAHHGRLRGRALLLERPAPGWVASHVGALHERAGCRRRTTWTVPRDDHAGLSEAVLRLPWSGEWLVRVSDGFPEKAVSHVSPLAAAWQAERNAFVEAHVGLVEFIVRRRGSITGIAREDLIQEGLLALCRAVERYDPDRGARFSSYAVPVIRHAVAQYVRRMGFGLGAPRPPGLVSVPPSSSATNPAEPGRPPASVSLDAPLDDGGALADRLADTERPGPDLSAARALDRERLRNALRKLPVQAEAIVTLHWGLDGLAPRSVHAVARSVGSTPAEVEATLRGALGVLRDLVTRSTPAGRSPVVRRAWDPERASGAGMRADRLTQHGRSRLYPSQGPV
jgi:RNA polymerase sigma factor (sigma-70 family)